jgi:hypothetical protein
MVRVRGADVRNEDCYDKKEEDDFVDLMESMGL